MDNTPPKFLDICLPSLQIFLVNILPTSGHSLKKAVCLNCGPPCVNRWAGLFPTFLPVNYLRHSISEDCHLSRVRWLREQMRTISRGGNVSEGRASPECFCCSSDSVFATGCLVIETDFLRFEYFEFQIPCFHILDFLCPKAP